MPNLTTLFILYGTLVAAIIAVFTGIWARMLGITKDQGVMQGQLTGIQQQLAQVNGSVTRLNGEISRLDSKIDNRFDLLDSKIDGKIDTLRDELKDEMRRNRDELKDEMRRNRDEMRRNTDRIILALIHHSHGDGTAPVFTIPPGAEPVAAND